jgi:hypothetical protein
MADRNCPFYGRHLYSASSKIVDPPFYLIDSRGNQCAVIQSAFAPCQMEIAQKPVDWRVCSVASGLHIDTDQERR